jgi:hypothetical protein
MNFNTLENKRAEPKSCAQLLDEFKKRELETPAKERGIKLKFLGVEPNDVYNPTIPFLIDGKLVIAGRVELRGDNAKSKVCFFEQGNDENTWVKIDSAPIFELEDPSITMIDNEIIFSGVQVSPNPSGKKDDPVNYRTVFYKGENLNSLEKFAVGPEKMKDIRIIEFRNKYIGVFTRPQDGIYKQGKIAYIELENLMELTPENILKAKVIENQFLASKEGYDEWGGTNQLHLLEDGKIGVIGHIAYLDKENKKHYYAMSFIFDPQTHTASPIKIIATRDDFIKRESKNPQLGDVHIPGGIHKTDREYHLYAGSGDVESERKPIDYPF